MTPSRPAPSKRSNQSAATLAIGRGRRQVQRRGDAREQSFELGAALPERELPQIPVAFAQHVQEHDRRRDLPRQQLNARGGRMDPQLQRVEVERAVPRDHDLAVEDAASRKLRRQRFEELGEVAVERLFVPALDQELVPVSKHQHAKPVPLGFEEESVAFGQSTDALGEHGKKRRTNYELHTEPFLRKMRRRGRSIDRSADARIPFDIELD